jgi:hypothetical protein
LICAAMVTARLLASCTGPSRAGFSARDVNKPSRTRSLSTRHTGGVTKKNSFKKKKISGRPVLCLAVVATSRLRLSFSFSFGPIQISNPLSNPLQSVFLGIPSPPPKRERYCCSVLHHPRLLSAHSPGFLGTPTREELPARAPFAAEGLACSRGAAEALLR